MDVCLSNQFEPLGSSENKYPLMMTTGILLDLALINSADDASSSATAMLVDLIILLSTQA